MSEVIITDATFATEVLQSDQPVLVDFWATWCGPCKVQAPIIEEIANEYAGKAKVAKIEVDENPESAQKYGIMSIPTLTLFSGGRIVWQAAGIQEKGKLIEQINAALSA